MRFACLFGSWLLVLSCFGQAYTLRDPSSTGLVATPAAGAPSAYLVKQGFEGTGYDNGDGANGGTWTQVNGLENPDWTAFGVADGSQALMLYRNAGAGPYERLQWGTTNTEVFYSFTFYTSHTNLTSTIIANINDAGIAQILNTGALRIFDGTNAAFATTTAKLQTQTIYYVWAHWNHATGVGDIEFQATSTRVGSGANRANFTAGNTANTIHGLKFAPSVAAGNNYTNVFDIFRLSITTYPEYP